MAQIGQQGHELPVPPDGDAGLLREGLVEEGSGQVQPGLTGAGAQVHGRHPGLHYPGAVPQGGHHGGHIPDPVEVLHPVPDGLEEVSLDGVAGREGIHPGRQEEPQLPQGELVEDRPDDAGHLALIQLQAAHRQAGHVVLLRQLLPQSLGGLGLGPGAV